MEITLPRRVYAEMRGLVVEGWFADEQSVMLEALRRYLETHRTDMQERFIREDVEWGLHGHD
jgi:Arc/MetJ-type ribon-helix-helix transcriptional regulator